MWRSAKRGLAAVYSHGGQAVQADGLYQRADVRLRMREPQRLPLRAQPLREAREIDHQRRVREAQAREVDDHVAGRGEGRRERTPAAAARGPVLIPLDAQDGELWIEADDPRKLQRTCG